MGSQTCRIVGKSQSVHIVIDPIIFTRTRTDVKARAWAAGPGRLAGWLAHAGERLRVIAIQQHPHGPWEAAEARARAPALDRAASSWSHRRPPPPPRAVSSCTHAAPAMSWATRWGTKATGAAIGSQWVHTPRHSDPIRVRVEIMRGWRSWDRS
jgi:hypothetical protein